MRLALFFPLAMSWRRSLGQLDTSTTPNLNITALTAANGESCFECWQFGPFGGSGVPGQTGALAIFLGNLANMTYGVVPPRWEVAGWHNAPAKQFVFFTSGLVHITLPNSPDEAWIYGGKYGFIVAADTADVSTSGHKTAYPGAADTIVVQIPIDPKTGFKYTVLHQGPCTAVDQVGI